MIDTQDAGYGDKRKYYKMQSELFMHVHGVEILAGGASQASHYPLLPGFNTDAQMGRVVDAGLPNYLTLALSMPHQAYYSHQG